MEFSWDKTKARTNLRKHGVSVEAAQSVFYDDYALQFFDEATLTAEEQFLLLGMSIRPRVLVVCHCEREAVDVIRIISAHKATARERQHYPGPPS